MARPPKGPGKADNWQICLFWRKSATLFPPFFVIFSSRMAPRRLKISGQTRNFISKICFSMARPPKVPGKADNWQICLFLQKSTAFFSPFFVIFSSRMAPRRLKISGQTRNFISKICFSMARPPKVPGKADNWQICLFLRNRVAVRTSFFGLK